MPAADLVSRVHRLPRIPTSALAELLDPEGLRHWGPHEENTARLLEIESYRLELDWADRTVDPDDAEARRARAEARRNGVKPPKNAPVPPIALRPKSIAEQRYQQYLDSLQPPARPKPVLVSMSRREFDEAMGLT
jgi:hypothetical protein